MPKSIKPYRHIESDMKTAKRAGQKTGRSIVCLFALILAASTFAAENNAGLQLPDDLAEKAATGTAPKYTIEERRVGGRLDQITVRRENGIDEVYDNTKANSLWQTEDDELGETQNLRRWTIGSW